MPWAEGDDGELLILHNRRFFSLFMIIFELCYACNFLVDFVSGTLTSYLI